MGLGLTIRTSRHETPISLLLTESEAIVVALVPGKKINFTKLSLEIGLAHSATISTFCGAKTAADVNTYGSDVLAAWKENGAQALYLIPLTEQAAPLKVSIPNYVEFKVHLHREVALIHYYTKEKSWADIYKITMSNKGPTVEKAYTLAPRASSSSTFSLSASPAENVVYLTWTLHTGETYLYSSQSASLLGEYPMEDSFKGEEAIHAVSEVVPRADGKSFAVRTFVCTTQPGFVGDTYLIRNGERAWTRKESLASIASTTWLELLDPASEKLADQLEVETHQSIAGAYAHRVARHINELITYGPRWLTNIPGRAMNAFIASETAREENTGKWRDFFGFRKYVVLATEEGGLVALDVGRGGEIVWQDTLIGLPTSAEWQGVTNLYQVGKGIVGIILYSGEYFEFDVFEGLMLRHEKLRGPVRSAFLAQSASGDPLVVALLEDGTVALGNSETKLGDKPIYLVTQEGDYIKGLRVDSSMEVVVMWTFRGPMAENITSFTTRPMHDPIASIGRVLGDRSVAYKYLNPHLLTVTTIDPVRSTASIYLLDSVSGAILYSATHEGVDVTQPIFAIISENWLVYTYFGDTDVTTTPVAKGTYLVVSELYESSINNDRGPLENSANVSSLASDTSKPYVISQAYLLPMPISDLAVTATKQGITAREILALTPLGIASIPKRVLDPRRPVGREPDAQEREEGLFPYNPVIEIDPRGMITHERIVLGLRNIVTSPAELESTSLVFAYGGDLFGTRVAPSLTFDVLGKGFGRVQLVATVLGLLVSVAFVAPMVRRKQINQMWGTKG